MYFEWEGLCIGEYFVFYFSVSKCTHVFFSIAVTNQDSSHVNVVEYVSTLVLYPSGNGN